MICDKYFHLYGKGKEIFFEEIKLPIKRGKWIVKGGHTFRLKECSECGTKWLHPADVPLGNYCSECGARMEEILPRAWGNVPPEYHGYEWFCPNGERKSNG